MALINILTCQYFWFYKNPVSVTADISPITVNDYVYRTRNYERYGRWSEIWNAKQRLNSKKHPSDYMNVFDHYSGMKNTMNFEVISTLEVCILTRL